MTYDEIAAMKRSYVGSSTQGPYKTDIGAHENLIRVVNKNFGGTNYVFEMSHDFWENNGIHYRYKAEGSPSSWKTLIDSDTIGSQHVAEADHASVANSLSLPRMINYDINSFPQANKVRFDEINNGSSIGGLGYHWWHMMTLQGDDTDYATQLAIMMTSGNGRTQVPCLAFRFYEFRGWNDWAVAISDKTIGQQTVKSFTATEVDHGCKFNGDVQSTTLLYAPKACTIGGLPIQESNNPDYANTITGARDVRFGSETFNLNFSRNAFIDYYLDHGYHFDEETEASTYYRDTGLLCYNGKMYFCAFKYYSSSKTTEFEASPVLTEEEGNANYLPIDGAEATGFNILDREILVGASKYVQTLQNKAGTIALKSDIPSVPSVVNNLTSTSTTSTLSANQGKVLNEKIAAVANTVSCKIAPGLVYVKEDQEEAITVSGNVISVVATAYRNDGLAGSQNRNERVCVRWDRKTAYIRNDGGDMYISYVVFYAK